MTGIEEHIEQLTKGVYKKRDTSAVIDENELFLIHGMAEGKGISQMAAKLDLSIRTVGFRHMRLFRKIGVHNSAQAVAWAFVNGYLKVQSTTSGPRIQDPMQQLYDGYVVGGK